MSGVLADTLAIPTYEPELRCGAWCQGGDVKMVPCDHPQFTDIDDVWCNGKDVAALAARLAEAERRATTLQADLDRAIESALKANAINTDWRRDWKAAIARAETAEARVAELEKELALLLKIANAIGAGSFKVGYKGVISTLHSAGAVQEEGNG